MKILVISDSHGDAHSISRVAALHADAELLLFLGDGLRDLGHVRDLLPSSMAVIAVSGNCDFFGVGVGVAREEELLCFEGKRILACHGHRYGVKGGLSALIASAHSKGVDVALFGHTHTPHEQLDYDAREHRLQLFNPGSLGRSPDRKIHYGLLEIRENGVLFSAAVLV